MKRLYILLLLALVSCGAGSSEPEVISVDNAPTLVRSTDKYDMYYMSVRRSYGYQVQVIFAEDKNGNLIQLSTSQH